MQKVLIIVGPTASGKSDLAVKLAKSLNGEVISADSRQVYKGLNIGTGKITKEEMRGVPHYLLDVADPKKRFTVSEYNKLARQKIEEIISRGKLPIVVGGTGFYIDALVGKASLPEVPPNFQLRKKLEKKTVEELFTMLKKKDPTRAETIDRLNKVRLIRALEIASALGKVPPLREVSAEQAQYDFIWIGIRPEKGMLEEKILKRLGARMPGMIKEAKNLRANKLSYKRMEELGLEYRYLARLLQDKMDRKKFVDELYKEIKHYAKRQNTWFKRNKDITWYENARDAYAPTLLALGSKRKAR
jgi:tRNA dimethylallyltransferase